MKTYAPNYYKDFHCIADKCTHSCCIGWEICIDSNTMKKYETTKGELGRRLKSSIKDSEFQLRDDESCPFLNSRGLCDIILEKGEDYLCEICKEHPRFYNFFSDRTEVGLGLSCEEAARIILSQEGTTQLVTALEDNVEEEELFEDEKDILIKRNAIFEILQDRSKTLRERIDQMLYTAGSKMPPDITALVEILRDMEILDPSWREMLESLKVSIAVRNLTEFDIAFEKLLIYFIYRHTPMSSDPEDFAARVAFAYVGYNVVRTLCAAEKGKRGECTFEYLCNVARMYSAEIEYSEENTQKLIEILKL